MSDSYGPMLTRRTLLGSSALAILGAAALPLSACGGSNTSDSAAGGINVANRKFVSAKAGTHAGTDTGAPWVSTNLAMNLTAGFSAAAKEDFYASANADWLGEQKVPECAHSYHPAIDDAEYAVRCRLRELLNATTADKAEQENAAFDEAQQAAINYYTLLSRWNDRDKSGYRGLEISLNEVELHSTIEDLVTYIFSPGRLTWLAPILDIQVVRNPTDLTRFTIAPRPMCFNIHNSAEATLETSEESSLREAKWAEEVEWLLLQTQEYGERAHELTTKAIEFQKTLAKAVVAAKKPADSYRIVSVDEFAKILHGYPYEAVKFCYGLDNAKDVLLYNSVEQYCSVLGQFIDNKYLDGIKAQIMCALTHAGYDFLTKEAFEHMHGEVSNDTLEDIAVKEVLSTMRGPVTGLYAQVYADDEAQAGLEDLAGEVRVALKSLIEANDWMHSGTKTQCEKKLDGVRIISMFPDYESNSIYPEIERFRDGGYVWNAKRQVEIYKRELSVSFLDVKAPDEYMGDAQTMTSDYAPSYLDARVTYDQAGVLQIGAGLACGVYDASQSQEERLARAGSMIAHELMHAFDARGWMRDELGRGKQLYDDADREELGDRTAVVAAWFDEECKPLGEPVKGLGERVKIEAIAEMGALKALMIAAEGYEGFDYQKFFEEYARFNACIHEEELFEEMILTGTMPLAATRVNLALGQLDKFTETVGLEKGDLMATAQSEKLGIF